MFTDADVVGRVHWSDPLAAAQLAVALASLPIQPYVDLVCVGTDRSTGDSLGPFIGSVLAKQREKGLLPPSVSVYGTIHQPVHALNLADTIEEIKGQDRESTVIAVDACLGRVKSIGCISVKKGPLLPGTGVNKQLPSVGDYHIIGVVNASGFLEHAVLQNTRLSLVLSMAEVIAEALILYFGNHSYKAEVALGPFLSF
ncbi:MAG TPA: spore protease YyaC [Firmicutes bacterium]|nr:spore protease YyaC [Bacillota bacterium]